jgi:uncharacterized phage-like protein YoqJ
MEQNRSETSKGKGKAVCFSGYRPQKFDFPMSGDEYDKFSKRLFDEIYKAVEDGCDTFMVGMAPGFDIIAAELVIHAKRAEPNIKLICVLPFGNFKHSEHFDGHWRERYDSVMEHSHETINVTDKPDYSRGCYDKRNKFLVDGSSLVICYSTGKKGGTENTIEYANSKNVAVVNVAT